MVMKIFDKKLADVPLSLAVFMIVVGVLISIRLVCKCIKPVEGMTTLGAPLTYNMKDGVTNVWRAKESESWNSNDWFASLQGNEGGSVPLKPGQLSFYYANKFSPDCCPAAYSTSTGCVCQSEKQAKYLNERGGNRTLNSLY